MSISELLSLYALYKKFKPYIDPVLEVLKKLFGDAAGGGGATPANPLPHDEYPPKYDPLKGDKPGDRIDNV